MHLLNRIRLPLRGYRHPFSYIEQFAHFEKNDAVLEIGVGDGYAVWTNAEKVKTIYGFDIAEPLVEFLIKNNSKANVHFRCVDITNTSGDDVTQFQNYFDKIYSIDTLLHVSSSVAFFKSVYKILKPGGKAFVVFPNLMDYGITHFDSAQKMEEQILESGLLLRELKAVAESTWLKTLKKIFVKSFIHVIRKFIRKKHSDNHHSAVAFRNAHGKIYHQSQNFDGTRAFKIIQKHPWYRLITNAYFEGFWFIARLGALYHYNEPKDFGPALEAQECQILLLILEKPAAEQAAFESANDDSSLYQKSQLDF